MYSQHNYEIMQQHLHRFWNDIKLRDLWWQNATASFEVWFDNSVQFWLWHKATTWYTWKKTINYYLLYEVLQLRSPHSPNDDRIIFIRHVASKITRNQRFSFSWLVRAGLLSKIAMNYYQLKYTMRPPLYLVWDDVKLSAHIWCSTIALQLSRMTWN